MIAYFLGIPGSGKTYYGVNVIYDNFAKNIPKKTKLSLKKDYINCYTNINEFNFDLTENVFKLDFDDFYSKLEILYCMYQGLPLPDSEHAKELEIQESSNIDPKKIDKRSLSLDEIKSLRNQEDKKIDKSIKKEKLKKASDAELIEKAKELNIFKSLFVIDECHNFLDTPDKVKIWWLTYHRHLYHDVYLITQSLQLVNLKYKPLAEAFYKAKSNSLILDKRYFNYIYFTESRMSKDSRVSTIKVRRDSNVFALYKSGDTVKSKNVVLRFIKIALVLFFLLLGLGYYFYHSLSSTADKTKKKQHVSTVVSSVPVPSSPVIQDNQDDISNLIYMSFTCTTSMCLYKNINFDVKLLSFAKKHFHLEVINSIRLFKSEYISIAVDSSFLNFLQGGSNVGSNQKSINISDDINPFSTK